MNNWEHILGISSIILLLLPVTLLLVHRKEGGYPFLALALYFIQIIFINLFSTDIIRISPKAEAIIGIINNLLDAPLMFIAIRYFTVDTRIRKILLYLSGAYILFELIVFMITGLTPQFLTICIGPGLLLVMAFCCYFFFNHVKSSFNRSKDTGKAFMSGALVFAYACFNFMYVMYYVLRNPHYTDLLKIYHITYIITAINITIGLTIIAREKRRKPVPKPTVKQDDINAFQYL